MDNNELAEAIQLYGSDLQLWPLPLRQSIDNDPQLLQDFLLLAAGEAQFEALLLQRHFEPHADDFTQRIIAAALVEADGQPEALATDRAMLFGWSAQVVGSTFIRPLLGMAATLVVGLVIGYSFPAEQELTADDNFSDYTALLYFQEDLL
jgi:hypothetical protein